VQVAEAGRGRDDRAQVQFHYDLSNDFYALFLDPEMVYSCAYFPSWEDDLAAAQQSKLEMICRKLRLGPGERLLDIGCGWGGLVCHAALHHGVTAHGVTLSQAQHDFAVEKVRRLGLEGRVTIELRDFRTFGRRRIRQDRLHRHVRACRARQPRRLHAGHPRPAAAARPLPPPRHHPADERQRARLPAQAPEYAAIVDYIFPGTELDHIGGTVDALEANGFEVHDVEGWREHYGRTCRLWTERLAANRAAAEAEVGAAKTRLWLLYLAGVCLGFERGTIGIFQTVASKRARGASGLPPTRGDLYAHPPLDFGRS
jgi:cyclopropane-fatty-acyl-phospholipid synthase